jgi:hypothetical protein
MSLLTRTRKFSSPFVPSAEPATDAVVARRHEDEAPEKAARPREAPEARRERWAEAPDAEVGRSSGHDHEFTHGRSQS